ncbi:MAG TPA: hypothetical protein VMR70_14730 [Flavisolibacter sp.]|nr:hypothetical protein [Flavisolibacter sp.]
MERPDKTTTGAEENKRFESDAQKLANKHLADPNHVITDEELKSIRVGMTPPSDEPTQEAVENAEEKVADTKLDSEEDTTPGSQKVTPWDVID